MFAVAGGMSRWLRRNSTIRSTVPTDPWGLAERDVSEQC
jgi:hypothetical protein